MKKIASIDVGLKRIGVAFYLSGIVVPQSAILRKNRNQASNDVSNLLKEWSIDSLVVGFPNDEDMQNRIKHFVSLLEFDGDIFYQDEDFSSYEAKEMTKGQFKQKKDGKIDSISAKLILQRWVDANKKSLG
jgi:putative Holliday junction resolvase